MNFSIANTPLRQYEVQGFVDFTPGSVTTRKGDGLAMISIIVAIFIFLAIIIIVTVHYGPQLRTVQITLYNEPMPQDMDGGVHLTDWKKLDSQRKCNTQCTSTLENNNAAAAAAAAGLNSQCASEEPNNIIEITYL